MMVMIVSGLQLNCSVGFAYPHHAKAKLPCWSQRINVVRCNDRSALQFDKQKFQYFHQKHVGIKHVPAAGSNRHHLTLDNDLPEVPFWLSFIKDAIWGLISLSKFLVEQPSQLKYIEWPGFQSTLKTATLTLVLVAVLIVALSSVDSVLCYLLAFLLRRTP